MFDYFLSRITSQCLNSNGNKVVLADQTDVQGSAGVLKHVDRLESSRVEIRRVLDLQILIMQFTAEYLSFPSIPMTLMST
jgi:hypothetical protein